MIVGFDARPALLGTTGFGRVARETLRALRRRTDVRVRAFAASWARKSAIF